MQSGHVELPKLYNIFKRLMFQREKWRKMKTEDVGICFTPISIGKATVKNRLIFPSMCTFYSDDQGSITTRIRGFVRARAAGGVGALVLPGTPYSPNRGRPAIAEDAHIRGWEELKKLASSYGMSLFCQLHPSTLRPGHKNALLPQDCTLEEIHFIVQAYAWAALRARKAGLDGVEVHGAHNSEVARFLSPFYNQRSDAYGGGFTGRSRLAVEMVRAIKETAGADFPLIFRFSIEERVQGGRDLAESLQLARLLANEGADALSVTVGTGGPGDPRWGMPPMGIPAGCHLKLAKEVKKCVSVPVIAVGRINDATMAARAIAGGSADMIAMGRALLADPDLPRKSQEGRWDEVRRCIACNQGCHSPTENQVYCLQAPRTGREDTLVFTRVSANDVKSVLIAGAGPAGLEAACVLAERGHHVRIFEQGREAGGKLLLAAKPPFKRVILEVVRYRLRLLRKLGVHIDFNTRVDSKTIEDLRPDIVIAAAGSLPGLPSFQTAEVYGADEVLSGRPLRGKRVLVVGEGMIECEVADFLAGQGREIEMVCKSPSVAEDLTVGRRFLLLERLKKQGVRFILDAKVLEVELPRVKLLVKEQEETRGDYDSVVHCLRRPNDEVAKAAKRCSFPVRLFTIGDAVAPRTAMEAIRDAAMLAAQV